MIKFYCRRKYLNPRKQIPEEYFDKIVYKRTLYIVKNFVGGGEYRYVFQLLNPKDNLSYFNLLVYRRKDSYKQSLRENKNSEHKKKRVIYLRKINCALREITEKFIDFDSPSLKEKVLEAKEYLNHGDFAQFNQVNESILRLRPHYSYALYLKALYFKKIGNKKEFKKIKKRIMAIEPNFSEFKSLKFSS